MSFTDQLGVACFGVVLMVTTLPAYIFAVVGLAMHKGVPEDQREARWATLNRRTIYITSLGWRCALALCWWIRIHMEGFEEMKENMGKTGRPCIVLTNHMSFLDTILVVTLLPLKQVVQAKMMVSSHIFKMPVIGKIAEAMGHLSVPFKNTDDPHCMELDKAVMEQRQQQLENYVRSGGVGGWFPEGRINPGDPHKVDKFRAGGMTMAVRIDAEVWLLAFCGNTVCWPRKAPLGGRPARIGVKVMCLCTSTHKFLEEANLGEGAEERAKAIALADRAHQEVQAGVDALIKEGFYSVRPQAQLSEGKKAQ